VAGPGAVVSGGAAADGGDEDGGDEDGVATAVDSAAGSCSAAGSDAGDADGDGAAAEQPLARAAAVAIARSSTTRRCAPALTSVTVALHHARRTPAVPDEADALIGHTR
jgi:hypothetical protein